MQLKLTFVAAFISAFASNMASAIPAELTMRAEEADGYIYFCTDANWNGQCANIGFTQSTCTNVPPAFNDDISSWGPDPGFVCTTYDDINCEGEQYEGSSPGFGALPPGINDAISSFACFRG